MNPSGTRVAVIGTGLAGVTVAATLALRQRRSVTLFSESGHPAASTVPLALLLPHLASQPDPLARVRRRGLSVTQAWFRRLSALGLDNGLRSRGILLVPTRARGRRSRDRLPAEGRGARRLDPGAALTLSGVRPAEPAVFHPAGACIAMPALIRALRAIAMEGINVVRGSIDRLSRHRNEWHLEGTSAGPFEQVILAAGISCVRLAPSIAPALIPSRGQMTALAATSASIGLRVPLSSSGHITPAFGGVHWVGSTFSRHDEDMAPRTTDDRANLARFREWWPDARETNPVHRFVGIRTTTPDRLPVVGQLEPGLWLSTSHGAHGLLTAPLAALLLADALEGRNHPLLPLLAPWRPALHRTTRTDLTP